MPLMMSILVPADLAAARNAWPLLSGPVGLTGIVTETTRPGLADSSALMAWKRVALFAV